jgi:hypothetical protein
MKSKVRFVGWSPGLNKVALTKLIRESADIPLNEAHDLVNRLLAGKVVEVVVSSDSDAHKLADSACALGAKTEFAETEIPAQG